MVKNWTTGRREVTLNGAFLPVFELEKLKKWGRSLTGGICERPSPSGEGLFMQAVVAEYFLPIESEVASPEKTSQWTQCQEDSMQPPSLWLRQRNPPADRL